MESDLELKPLIGGERESRYDALSQRLAHALSNHTNADISQKTSHHPESVRRYISGSVSMIPADFVGQAVCRFNLSAQYILTGDHLELYGPELRLITTDRLINELGKRLQMIEDCSVGASLVRKGLSPP